MPYVYRRPFDYPQHRQAFNVWAMQGLIEAGAASATLTAHAAVVSSTASPDKLSRATRFSAQGVFRRRWPYAEHQARIILTYKDADAIESVLVGAAFTGHAARVQLGAVAGASLTASVETAGVVTFAATVTGSRRDPVTAAAGTFVTYAASLTRTTGLGQSRIGATSAKSSGAYAPGTTRRRPARVVSRTNQIVKAK